MQSDDVAAAVLLADDHEAERLYAWMTVGVAESPDAALSHDSWNEHETVFPPGSYITISELHAVVTQWAFGDELPPPAVRWAQPQGVRWL